MARDQPKENAGCRRNPDRPREGDPPDGVGTRDSEGSKFPSPALGESVRRSGIILDLLILEQTMIQQSLQLRAFIAGGIV